MGKEYCPAGWPNAIRSLIQVRDSASIGKTYCVISKTSGNEMIQEKLITAVALSVLLMASCRKHPASSAAHSNKVRVGYIGSTCEAPIYAGYEKGFFKDEGLEPELVKCNWATYKDALALGSYDITHHLVMYFLKPIEQGLDVRFLAGIHRGCLRIQTGANRPIPKTRDLKGKRI